jgi:hypothetical protein
VSTENIIRQSIDSAQRIALAGMKGGYEIGYREGMLYAAAMCEAKAKLHAEYLPPNFYHKDGDHDQAATCGRRDECSNLAYEIREVLRATQEPQQKPDLEHA